MLVKCCTNNGRRTAMKSNRLAVGGIVLLAVMVFATPAVAGDLNPPGAPAPTMKTLDQIPPTWDQILRSDDGDSSGCNSTRFKCVMDGTAVLDRETGLVWERSPDTGQRDWSSALSFCFNRVVGAYPNGRRGLRLPTIEELMSLVNPSGGSPALPTGHPFVNVQPHFYYSATTSWSTSLFFYFSPPSPGDPDGTVYPGAAWGGNLDSGVASTYLKYGTAYVWCVRGGHGHDGW
jgi:hypothetical protein